MTDCNPKIQLYRKRHIPDEFVHLKKDEIVVLEKNFIVTRWDALKPRSDIAGGISAYLIDKGIKISRVHNADNELVYWYCDIIDTQYDSSKASYVFEDLLIDIIIDPDGNVKVVDLDELGDVLTKCILSMDKVSLALHRANQFLTELYHGDFPNYQKLILPYII